MFLSAMRVNSPTFLAAALLMGCMSHEEFGPRQDPGLSSAQFPDIPVPDGMRLYEGRHDSHSFEAGSFRYGDFKYAGSVPIPVAVAYMTKRMKLNKWSQEEPVEIIEGRQHLRFRRHPYLAHCIIWKEEDEQLTRMSIEVRTKL